MEKSNVWIRNGGGVTSSDCMSHSYCRSFVHSSGSISYENINSNSKFSEDANLSQERIEKLEFVKEKHKEALKLLSL